MAAVTAQPSAYWNTGGQLGNYVMISNDRSALYHQIRRALKRRGLLSERGVLPVLTGNAVGAGGAVIAAYNRIQYGNIQALMPGSLQPVETVTVHTGVTTAVDEAAVDSFAVLPTQPAYVRNGDGNPRGNNGG